MGVPPGGGGLHDRDSERQRIDSDPRPTHRGTPREGLEGTHLGPLIAPEKFSGSLRSRIGSRLA
jgi:hypothetical protein